MKVFYNSSTGNSLYVAKTIRDELKDCKLVSMSKALKEDKIEACEDVIGFIYPIHCGGLPIVVNEFISKLKINDDAYVFAIESLAEVELI